MGKSYLFAFDASGLLLSLLYIVLLIAALISIAKYLKVGFSQKAIAMFFIYYYLYFIVSTFMPFVPDLSDTDLFAKIITENYFPPHQSNGVKLYYAITYPIRVLSMFKLEIFILFQIFIFTISVMVLWKSWQIVLVENKQDKNLGNNLFLILAATYPAFLLYIPVPLREYFVFFGFTVMVYGIIERYYYNKGLRYILLGSILLLFGRPQLIVIVMIFLAVFQKNKWIKYGLIGIGAFAIPYLFSSVMGYSKFSPDFFTYLRNHGAEKQGILGYGKVAWETYGDMIADIPALIAQFLLAPFPILHENNPLKFIAILADALYAIIIYLSVIYAGLRVSKIYLFIFIVSATLFSIWEYTLAGAARHRMPLIAILLPAASYGLLKFYQDIKAKK